MKSQTQQRSDITEKDVVVVRSNHQQLRNLNDGGSKVHALPKRFLRMAATVTGLFVVGVAMSGFQAKLTRTAHEIVEEPVAIEAIRTEATSTRTRVHNASKQPSVLWTKDRQNSNQKFAMEDIQSNSKFLFNWTLAKRVGCCRYEGSLGNDCRDTCYTEALCHSPNTTMEVPLFPFTSPEEKSWFSFNERPPSHRSSCMQYMRHNNQFKTPTWCQLPSSNPRNNTNTGIDLSQIPTGCSQFNMGSWSGPFDRTILIPKGKLFFCGIPKVGITQWLKFARFVFGAADYQSLPYYKQDIKQFQFDQLSRRKQEQVLTDPSWTRAIFLRDPAERLLSSYLDKVARKKEELKTPAKFAAWVDELEWQHLHPENCTTGWCFDPHWRPQVFSCGIRELLPYFDFVGSISNAANHSKELLETVGLWEDFGRHYITSPEQGVDCSKLPPNRNDANETLFRGGFQQNIQAREDKHTTKSSSKMDKFYTPELMDKVKRIYKDDFVLFDALQREKTKRWLSGSALAHRLNPNCFNKAQSKDNTAITA